MTLLAKSDKNVNMSRPLRIQYPGAWYHVMNRGRRAEKIFSDEEDYTMFVELLSEAERLEEITRMLGGLEMTEKARQHAREMLTASRRRH